MPIVLNVEACRYFDWEQILGLRTNPNRPPRAHKGPLWYKILVWREGGGTQEFKKQLFVIIEFVRAGLKLIK